jgi:hypothetical protein
MRAVTILLVCPFTRAPIQIPIGLHGRSRQEQSISWSGAVFARLLTYSTDLFVNVHSFLPSSTFILRCLEAIQGLLIPSPQLSEFGLEAPFDRIYYLFANDGKEFETVATAARRDEEIGTIRMIVHQKIATRSKARRIDQYGIWKGELIVTLRVAVPTYPCSGKGSVSHPWEDPPQHVSARLLAFMWN